MMIADNDIDRVLNAVKSRLTADKRYPVSTYRLQFNRFFTFRDATRLVPYLHKLGITDIYASPYLKAHPGSLHGYDISDHNRLNPEIGSRSDYRNFIRQLGKYDMGQILDFVPNHMGFLDNPWWTDVLENGPSSPYSHFFDIDWYPVKAELREKVLLPILEDQYGKVLLEGGLRLTFENATFMVIYRGYKLPVDPKTIVQLLTPCLERLQGNLSKRHPDYQELQGVINACNDLPSRSERDEKRINERHREKEIIKKRLDDLYQRNEKVRACLNDVITAFNGHAGNDASFDRLHKLLESQAYRLSYWRVASDEINYRRFFDINNLVVLRMEDVRVFDSTHRLLRELFREGMLTGLRIDHVDGLFDPEEYFRRLQGAYLLELCWSEAERIFDLTETNRPYWEEKFLERLEAKQKVNPRSFVKRPFFVIVEKILGEKEILRETWPVDGTTGYEFVNTLNGLFVNKRNARALRNIYQWFTKINEDYKDITNRCKNLIMQTSMSAEVNLLAHQLDRVSERSRWYRDFTLNSLRDAIREVIACFPVYRTYIDALKNVINDQDKAVINAAIVEAKRRNPAISGSIFDFIRDTLLLKYPPDMSEDGRQEQQLFVMRFQQITGPIMAKGVEDTAFYIYNPLVSLNEVGGNPERFGNGIDEFHRQNMERRRKLPHSLICTSTHDSKRSEDVRARLNVLSEIPQEWKAALTRWSQLNRRKKVILGGEPAPDRNEEYLIYQTLLGTYPSGEMKEPEHQVYLKRMQSYILKAIREAKVHTSWISPDTTYEEAVMTFVSGLLEPSPSNAFLSDFLQLNQMIARCGIYNSLAQLVLKLLSPGTPDIYQGNELWNFSLVDPDNRQPVNFALRVDLLKRLTAREPNLSRLVNSLMDNRENGEIKLYITCKALTYRRENNRLFNEGTYIPLEAEGVKKGHICAFVWQKGRKQAIVIVPRIITRLTRNATIAPLGYEAWGDTTLLLPRVPQAKKFRNILTAEIVNGTIKNQITGLKLAEVFSILPVAVLETIP
jgi:(1->4)-alpha-D-glucan 1-alpha-D-glucosylmutase